MLSAQHAINYNDSTQQKIWIAIIHANTKWQKKDQITLEKWLKVRMNLNDINIYFE